MKWSLCAPLLLAGILISGCASHKPKTSASVPEGSTLIVTPDTSLAAKVIITNPTSRFVVLHFPAGQLPGMGQRFFLYHDGLKTGEVKISGPQDDNNNNIVADLVAGNAQVGDEVRDQ
jgi:hypothetical protein